MNVNIALYSGPAAQEIRGLNSTYLGGSFEILNENFDLQPCCPDEIIVQRSSRTKMAHTKL